MPDLGKSGMVRMAFSISEAVGSDWIMVSFGNFTIYGLLIDTLFGRFARQWSIANRRISLCEAKPLRRERGGWLPGATRTFQRLPGPTGRGESGLLDCWMRGFLDPWNDGVM